MTTIGCTLPARRPVVGAAPTTIRRVLERIHAPWLKEVAEMLEPTQHEDAGVWSRWNAIRYLNSTFAERLLRERTALADVPRTLTDSEATTLWALGELLDLLSDHLQHLVGLCQHGAEFTSFTRELRQALEHWCHSTEETLGRVAWDKVPRQSQKLLLRLAQDAAAREACTSDQHPAQEYQSGTC
ncbi:MAG TPA: hypothetical protein VHR41_07215 [Gemmatimonadales bacterium]|nr:hypothetical protein [Gemmatimonadales bacterium]